MKGGRGWRDGEKKENEEREGEGERRRWMRRVVGKGRRGERRRWMKRVIGRGG